MHPIVIMAHEKSDALEAAKKSLEESGLKVKILMTGSAKMVDFLGALADVEDEADAEEQEPAANTDSADEKPAEADGNADEQPAEKMKTEAIFMDLPITVIETDGQSIIHPSKSEVLGESTVKVTFAINEDVVSFWAAAHDEEYGFNLTLGEESHTVHLKLGEPRDTPVIYLNSEVFKSIVK